MGSGGLVATRLRCEYRVDPLGVDVLRPRLSWELAAEAAERGQRQSAYRVLVASEPERLARGEGDLWDSGEVTSGRSVHVAYDGAPLGSGQRCWWTVRVRDRDGRLSAFAPAAWWEMGLLRPGDWRGGWVGAEAPPAIIQPRLDPERVGVRREWSELDLRPGAYLRRRFHLPRGVRWARLYAAARGVYEARLNGRRVGDAVLAPGWTDYRKRVQYQTYDVTSLLWQGDNALAVVLGTGWYAGHIGFFGRTRHYGEAPRFLGQLVVEQDDGTVARLATDGEWRVATGPLRWSDLLMGEWYDARREMPGWDAPGSDDSGWSPAAVEARDDLLLVADRAEPARVTEDLAPRSVGHRDDGTAIVDLGQNIAGWVRLRAEGPAGTAIRLRFGEVLDGDGRLYTANLRSAHQTDTWVLAGTGEEVWEPRFTVHGFRYVEVAGYPAPLDPSAITGRVVESATEPAGTFACSDALVNQLQRNIVWGQRSNFLSIPTDCPQRDERLGWLADAQIFARTAAYNRDVAAFFTKWLVDVADAQSPEGAFPDVAPRLVAESDGAPAWGDAGVIVPWVLYQHYGDTRLVEEHFQGMVRWLAWIGEANPDHIRRERRGNDYGDWLALDTGRPSDPFACGTPKELLATAYWAQDARLLARMARAIGREPAAVEYEALFEQIKAAFVAEFVAGDGRVGAGTQTGYLLALAMDLLPEGLRPAAARLLVEEIERHHWHLTTGFLGVGLLCPVLTEAGYPGVAYRLLRNETFPSWGYAIRHGATTLWERWDGWTEEGGFQNPTMNSFNHYAFGAVGEWLYRHVAGIDVDPARPGFAHVVVRPHPGGGLEWAKAEHRSMHGPIASGWRVEDGWLTLEVVIPANATATVHLPAATGTEPTEGEGPAAAAAGVTLRRRESDRAVYEIGSGSYRFRSRLPAPSMAPLPTRH